jgi:hypothetical protein
LSLRATRIGRHSWPNSSMTLSMRASLVGAILDKVVGPNARRAGIFRPQPHARPIGEPKTASFGLFVRDLQPLSRPLPTDQPAWRNRAAILR